MSNLTKTLKAKIAAARERSEAILEEIQKSAIETTLLEIQLEEISERSDRTDSRHY